MAAKNAVELCLYIRISLPNRTMYVCVLHMYVYIDNNGWILSLSLSDVDKYKIGLIESHVKLLEYMGAAYYMVYRVITFVIIDSAIIGSRETQTYILQKLLYTIKN